MTALEYVHRSEISRGRRPAAAVILIAAVFAGSCGRFAFDETCACDDGNPCTDDTCTADGACTSTQNTAPCDDGNACTADDRCTSTVCGPGATTSCAGGARVLVRSVGVGTGAALVAETTTLRVTGSTGAFGADLPTAVGVGDVIEYDSNGDRARDALAVIYRRLSPRIYEIRSIAAETPIAMAIDTTDWKIFRAYLSLADAVDVGAGGTHNPNITAAPFDTYVGGRDLVANDEQWTFACYDDGQLDTAGVEICSSGYTRRCAGAGWTTDATHYLRVFTPTDATEVGAPQRHRGVWGAGYRRTDGIIVYEGFVRLDGLSIRRATTGIGRTYYVETEGHGGEVRISNSFGWNAITGASKVFDIWDTGQAALGPAFTVFALWNDIAYNESTGDARSGFYINSNRARAYLFNCTAYVKGGGAFYESSGGRATLSNCLGYSESAAAFVAEDGFDAIASSASNDGSLAGIANGASNQWNQAMKFASTASIDFHLEPSANAALEGAGVDLSAHPAFAFSDDIDGDGRPAGGWDIGADQTP